jgi:plasmid maintenance system antidote protein VapI
MTINQSIRRRKRAKGNWMQLRDLDLLLDYMEDKDMSQARLGRHAECSRQFIHKLVSGQIRTCTPAVASRIEEALGVLPKTLFMDKKSATTQHLVAKRKTTTAA